MEGGSQKMSVMSARLGFCDWLNLVPLLLASHLAAQNSPSIHVASRLVEINAVVSDKNGHPVRNLTKDEFVVTDDGNARKLAVFSAEVAEDHTGSRKNALQISPLVVANRPLRDSPESIPVTVILFDGLNIDRIEDFLSAKRELASSLKMLRPGDSIALYSLNGPTIRVIHDFTDDTASLIQAAHRISGMQILHGSGTTQSLAANSAGSSAGEMEQLANFLGEASRSDEAARLRLRTEWTLSALEAIAHHLIGGRKNLIWISGAFPTTIGLDPETFLAARQIGTNQELYRYSEREKDIAQLFAAAEVAIYPIDPTGLTMDTRYQASVPDGYSSDPRTSQPKRYITAGEHAEPFVETMSLLANQTGGRAFYNANGVAESIQLALEDARVNYTLGFYVPENAWDGKYHKLAIRVNRPGVQVRTRKGYIAAPPSSRSIPNVDEALRAFVASPVDGEAIRIRVNVESNPLQRGLQRLVLAIDPRDIRFEDNGGRMRAQVDIVFAQQAADGRIVKGEKKTLQYALLPSSYQSAVVQGLFLTEPITIGPEASRLRVVIRDASNGATGSVSIPITTKHP